MENASTDDSLVVILFSNTQENIYPKNRPSEFRNQLAYPLKLGIDWEVALLDVHFLHNFDNFVQDVKTAVLLPTDRDEYSQQLRYIYNSNSNRWDVDIWVEINNADGTKWAIPTIVQQKRIEDLVTPQMLKDRNLTRKRKGMFLTRIHNRTRRYDILLDFPHITPMQRFEEEADPKEIYDRYYIFHLDSSTGKMQVFPATDKAFFAANTNKFYHPLETKRGVLKQLSKVDPNEGTTYCTYLLPRGHVIRYLDPYNTSKIIEKTWDITQMTSKLEDVDEEGDIS